MLPAGAYYLLTGLGLLGVLVALLAPILILKAQRDDDVHPADGHGDQR